MKRKYTTEEYSQFIDNIRMYFPQASITTDIMVGFPGEGDKEFKETYDFAKRIGFSKIHVFKYSPRRGTPAFKYPNQVNGNIKEERSKELIALADEQEKLFYKKFIGSTAKVLFEQNLGKNNNIYEGLTDNYIRVLCDTRICKGKILPVTLKG